MTADSDGQVDLNIDLVGNGNALAKAAATTQLDDRHVGRTVGGGISPPYPPGKLAALQEMNGTHAVAVKKKAVREVGFGFDVVPHPQVDDPDEDQEERAEEFWFGHNSVWKIGPQGTPAATPQEVFEMARRDWHGIGFLGLEIIYGDDDKPHGLAHVPAEELRVRRGQDEPVQAGYGYVQHDAGNVVYYGEAGDRGGYYHDESVDQIYVDKETGEKTEDPETLPNGPANEVLFVPNPHPLSKYYGIPDWVAEIQTMVADDEAKRFNRQFFEYDAMPQYAVIVENGRLTEESRNELRKLVTRLRKDRSRRMVVLEAEDLADSGINVEGDSPELRIEPLSRQGEEDMAFTEFRRLNEHEVAKVHEVPHVLINRLESSNRANAREQIRDFTEEVIEPQQRRFAERIYRVIHQDVLDVTDWTIEFKTKTGDRQRQRDIAKTEMEATNGAMTVNEARENVGLEPKEEFEGILLAELNDPKIGEQLPGASPQSEPAIQQAYGVSDDGETEV